VSSLCAAYTGGAVLFLLLNPGAIAHARRVSQGIERRLQFGEALWGIPQMVIPWPSFLPAWICWLAGAAVLGAILALGAYVGWAMATRGGRMCPRITPARSACADDVSPGAAGGRMDTKGSLTAEHTERTEGSGETEDGTPVDGASVADGGAPALRFQRSALSASSGLPTSAFSFHPSALPPSAGCGLRTPGCVLLTEHRTLNTDHCATSAAAVLAGMLGAGLLQFLLVGFGFYLGWATGPNHLCAFWLLTVLAWGLLLHLHPQRWLRVLTVLGLLGMVGMQVLYGWHCHRIKPRTNVQYIGSQQPDLVYLDNLTRGMVLQVTDVMPPHQRVLAAPPERLSALLATGELARYAKVLYLPMDTSVTESKPQVLDLFRQAGWTAEELPVVHPGLYEAVVLTR
jgi:hypothetical protein